MNTVEIRLELLKTQGIGCSKAEVVKHLTEKFNISRSACYYHFKTMDKWIGNYFDFKNAKASQYNILNQLNNINREASFNLIHATEDNARIGYMRVRLEALSKLAVLLGLTTELEIKPTQTIILRIEDNIKKEMENATTNTQ